MRAALFSVAVIFAFAAPAHAERFALSYDGIGMGFVPLGGVILDAEVSEDSYQITATLQSRGLLNLFEPTDIRARAAGRVAHGGVRWESYELDHRYNRKHRTITLESRGDGAIAAQIEPNYRVWGEPAASAEQIRRSRDPLSSLVAMTIDVGQSRRCAGAYPTFDGRFHYLLELAGGEIGDFDHDGYDGEVLKCALAYIAVAGFEPRDSGRVRIPHGEIWFALMPDTSFAPPVWIATPWPRRVALRLSRLRRARVDVEYTFAPAP